MKSASELPRIVVDTNVFVSAVLFKRGNPHRLIAAWHAEQFTLVIAPEQRDEIDRVLRRASISGVYLVEPDEIDGLMRRIDVTGHMGSPSSVGDVEVRDPKDQIVLDSALDGHADYLVTGDKDLLVLADEPAIRPLRIVTIRELLDVLAAQD
jgi:putative PIN family toxin of toxin-antitoxin system